MMLDKQTEIESQSIDFDNPRSQIPVTRSTNVLEIVLHYLECQNNIMTKRGRDRLFEDT